MLMVTPVLFYVRFNGADASELVYRGIFMEQYKHNDVINYTHARITAQANQAQIQRPKGLGAWWAWVNQVNQGNIRACKTTANTKSV